MLKRDGLMFTLYILAIALGINMMNEPGTYWAGALQVTVCAVLMPLRFGRFLQPRK